MAALLVLNSLNKDSQGSTTWQLIIDFCRKTLKKKPTDLSAIYCTVLDVEIGEGQQEEELTQHGVTMIPAVRPQWSNPAYDPPAIHWLLNHVNYYPDLQKLEDIEYVVALSPKAKNAACAIHENLFPKAKLHQMSSKPAALFVAHAWNKDELGLTGFHRTLVKDFCERKAKAGEAVKAYCTVLDVKISDDQKKDAASCGITLISAQRKEGIEPKHDPPRQEWLLNHESYYQDLEKVEDIQYVVGYAPKTGLAAAGIRAKLFPKAKLVLINHACPENNCLEAEDQGMMEFAEKMRAMASKADLLFSIGPKIYQYFENAYRAEFNGVELSEIPHEEMLPRPSDAFWSKDPLLKEITQLNILTFGQIPVDTNKAVKKCRSIATTINTAVIDCNRSSTICPEWRIGTSQSVSKVCMNSFVQKIKAHQIKPQFQQGLSAKTLLTSLQQCHLCIPMPFYTDYSFHGLEAMVFGLPTYVFSNSHIAYFIKKYFGIHEHNWIVQNPDEKLDRKILQHLSNTKLEFQKAKALKKDMNENKAITVCHSKFASLLTTKQPPARKSTEQRLKQQEEDSINVQIGLDDTKLEEQVKALSAQPGVEQVEEIFDDLEAVWKSCKHALKRKVEEIIADQNGCEEIKKQCMNKLGDDVDPASMTAESLGILLRLLTLSHLYKLKQTCRCGSLARAFESLLITDEMREIASGVGLQLQLKATYDWEKFKRIELFFIHRDGGDIHSLKINDIVFKEEYIDDPTICSDASDSADENTTELDYDVSEAFKGECNQSDQQQEMDLQLIRDGTKVLTLPVPDENVSLLCKSLLPYRISQIQITEYIVKQLLEQISEKTSEIHLQKSVLQQQLDEARQEKAILIEHIRQLTKTIHIAEKELTKSVGIQSMYEKLSSELKEKEKIINELEAKLSGLEEIQSELELQRKTEIQAGSQYSGDEEGMEGLSTSESKEINEGEDADVTAADGNTSSKAAVQTGRKGDCSTITDDRTPEKHDVENKTRGKHTFNEKENTYAEKQRKVGEDRHDTEDTSAGRDMDKIGETQGKGGSTMPSDSQREKPNDVESEIEGITTENTSTAVTREEGHELKSTQNKEDQDTSRSTDEGKVMVISTKVIKSAESEQRGQKTEVQSKDDDEEQGDKIDKIKSEEPCEDDSVNVSNCSQDTVVYNALSENDESSRSFNESDNEKINPIKTQDSDNKENCHNDTATTSNFQHGDYHTDDESDASSTGSTDGYETAEDVPTTSTSQWRPDTNQGKKDDKYLKDNLLFYKNIMESEPRGDLIDNIHEYWWGDYDKLERHHDYIQWIFPIREKSMNNQSQELQLHEAEEIIKDKQAWARVLKSYEMMLDFYGMKLVDKEKGTIQRAANWKERYSHLNRSTHNYLRITRILKSLGELGYEHLKTPFVEFVLTEALEKGELKNCVNSCVQYWLHTINSSKDRKRLTKYFDSHYNFD